MSRNSLLVAFVVAGWTDAASAQICTPFTDMQANDPFCSSAQWMYNRGITLGCTANEYCPAQFVRRDQMAAFMYRLGFQNAFLKGGNAFGTTAVLGTTDAQPVDIVAHGVRIVRYGDRNNILAGHADNFILGTAEDSVVAGGGGPATSACSTPHVSRSCNNFIQSAGSGGAIGGGIGNAVLAGSAVVSGGFVNTASGGSAAVTGGAGNTASGAFSTAGGLANIAAGNRSFAVGSYGNAAHAGCFIWGDTSSDNYTSCFGNNEFVARSLGGFYFWTAGSNDSNYSGARLAPGTGAWAVYSDADGKEAVEPVDTGDVLERLVRMPVLRWQWRAESGGIKHMGPTAQDFRAAFNLGDSDKQIVTIDSDGVALAAIQGLNAKLEAKLAERDAEIRELRNAVRELQRVAR